jgi:O-antigen ligase
LRLLVAAGVLLLSAYLAPRASWYHLVLLLGAGVALVFLRWPPSGLATLIVATLVVPFAIGTGTETPVNITVLLLTVLIGLWMLDMVRRQEVRLLPSYPILPLVAFAGVATLAFAAGTQTWLVFAETAPLRSQAGGLAVFLLSAGAFLLMAHQVRDLRWLRALTWLFLALAAPYVAGRLVPGLDRLTDLLFQRGADGSLFWVWLVALAVGQAAFNRSLGLPWRLGLGGLVAATLYLRLVQDQAWTSGWLPPLVAAVAVLWAGAPRLGLLATLAGGVLAVLDPRPIVDLLLIGDNQYSLTSRLEAWRIVGEIVKVNPLLGLGPANYHWYTPLFPILGWYVTFNSHNNYVDIVAQTGLLGLACFLWFAWAVGRLAWRLRTRVPAGFARAYVCGAFGGLAGTLAAAVLGDWVLPFIYNVGLTGFRASVLGWFFLGGLVALEQIAHQQSHADA